MTWGHRHGGDSSLIMVLNLHFVMGSQQFVMGLSLVATFHYGQRSHWIVKLTTFVGNLSKIEKI